MTPMISTEGYNSIANINSRVVGPTHEQLVRIGQVFVQHGIRDYGAGLLHRHSELQNEHVLCHFEVEPGVDECRPVRYSPSLVAHSYVLDEAAGHFKAYEYATAANKTLPSPLPTSFTEALAACLASEGLSSTISIAYRDFDFDSTERVLIERQDGSTLRSEVCALDPCWADASEITLWDFSSTPDGGAAVRVRKRCVLFTNGVHERRD